jgi:hypothetical protein
MTWAELERAGFSIVRHAWPPVLQGPDDPKLLATLRFELATRAERVGAGDQFAVRVTRYGRCTHCGDELARCDVAGTCGLCELARAKALGGKK